ncbi:MAG: hypothetical protein Q4E32_00340 [Bacteroidales bacterium]|nr:hypothetical protein [Bacteroidales bacterium]
MKPYKIILLALMLVASLSATAQTRDLYIYMDGSSTVKAYENVFPIAPAEPYYYVVDSVKIVHHLQEPTGLRISQDEGTLYPVISWKPVMGAKFYEVYRSVNGAPYTFLQGSTLQNTLTNEYYFADNDPQVGTSAYRVRARGIVIESPLSSEIVTNYIDPSAIQTIDGTYNVTEYELDDNYLPQKNRTYQMVVTLDSSDPTTATITNFWNFGGSVEAIYDQEEQTLYIPSGSKIGEHSTYGNICIRGVNSAISAYTSFVTLKFTPFGGTLTEDGYFQAYVSAGSFGIFRIDAVKDTGNGTTGGAAPRKVARQMPLKPMILKSDQTQKTDCNTLIENPVMLRQ